MRSPYPVGILRAGVWHAATARLATSADQPAAIELYRRTHRHSDPDLPVVQITFDQPGPATKRGAPLLKEWVGWVTGGEAIGFAIPAVIAALTATAVPAVFIPTLLLAGGIEGIILGAAQAFVLRKAIPSLPARRWAAVTGIAAVFAYATGLIPSATAGRWPQPTWIAVCAMAATLLLLSIGTAQWLILRRYGTHSARWIAITAAARLAGLAAFLAIAMPLWHEQQPTWQIATVGLLAGLAMAFTVALVTGTCLAKVLPRRCESDS